MNKCFFTLRDFSKSGGGALRIRGMINALTANGISTTLVCRTNQDDIDISSKLIKLDISFTPLERKIFLFLLSFEMTFFLVDIIFFSKLKKLTKFIDENNLHSKRMLFCEYIDNSIGYYLKRRNIITSYSIDIHGVAHIEFSGNSGMSLFQRIYFWLKYKSSISLDNKVLANADVIIFASEAMRQYFIELYPEISNKKYIIIPYVLGSLSAPTIDKKLVTEIKGKYKIRDYEDIVFFAGSFKKLGGIVDLMHAFNNVLDRNPHARLFMIGEGSYKEKLIALVQKYNIKNQVIFAGVIPYNQLLSYQSLASVIVCPDTDNPYSKMIVHLKYFDSLLSGKIVINGNFNSILEINKDDHLSVSFSPSNIQDLSDKILFALNNQAKLEEKYKNVPNYVKNNFTYDNYLSQMLEI